MRRFYVTTPIYYVSDVPHVGNSYTTIAADALRRYHLLRGDATRMLTGTDEHGLKIEREAQSRGVSPAQFVKDMSDRFEAAWPKLEILSDDFIRTTQPRHERLVQELWRVIDNKGDLYLGTYEDWYCVGCESYKTDKELLPGNICPLHNKPVERLKEETYFFRLSNYAGKLLELYRDSHSFVQPESRKNEVVSFVEGGLKDLSVSRTSFTWGIPVPGNPKHIMYVWFDALANYWTALQDSEEHKRFWDEGTVVHLVGKDILRQHAVYWPAFLMSAGLPLPKTVFAHGFLTFGGQKMSKSLRNSVDPIGIARSFGQAIGAQDPAGADVLRYQLLRAIAFGQDGDFDLRAMVERYNADLGKNLGNLLARTLGLCAKLTGGKVPEVGERTRDDEALATAAASGLEGAAAAWDAKLAPHRALEDTVALSTAANVYVDRTAPWAEDKKGNAKRVATILGMLLQVLECLSVMIWPVLPSKSDEMRRQLGLSPLAPNVGQDLWPKGLRRRQEGEPLAPGAPLFPTIDDSGARALVESLTPRVDVKVEETSTAAGSGTTTSITTATPTTTSIATPARPSIPYEAFATVDLRVGIVRACERIPRKDKLLKLAVDLGETAPCSIIAGLAMSFQPEELIGRRVVVVANLAPREFGKGLVSHGMLLATGESDKLSLVTVAGEVVPGAKVK